MNGELDFIERETARLLDGRVKTCDCGCGRPAPIATRNDQKNGIKAGQPRRFIKGHHRRTGSIGQTPERKAYQAAKSRCERPEDGSYKNYGGRGISFKFKSFEEFFLFLGKRPSRYHSLERIDNDDDYAPWNCKWGTTTEQAANKRHGNQYVASPPLTYDFEETP